jgi:hypothetical protein
MTIVHAFDKKTGEWVVSASSEDNIIEMFGDEFVFMTESEICGNEEKLFDENGNLKVIE